MSKLFAIQIEVEEIAVGKVMRQLSKMPGVAKLNLDIEHKPNGVRGPYKKQDAAPKKTRRDFAEPGKDVLVRLLYTSKRPLPYGELRAAFGATGRSPKSANSLIHNLKLAGDIVQNDEGWTVSKKMRDRLRHRKGSK